MIAAVSIYLYDPVIPAATNSLSMWLCDCGCVYLCDSVIAAVSIYLSTCLRLYLPVWLCDCGCIYLSIWSCDSGCVYLSICLCDYVFTALPILSMWLCHCGHIFLSMRFRGVCVCISISVTMCVQACACVCVCVRVCVCIHLCDCAATSSIGSLARGRSRGGRGIDPAQSKAPDPFQKSLVRHFRHLDKKMTLIRKTRVTCDHDGTVQVRFRDSIFNGFICHILIQHMQWNVCVRVRVRAVFSVLKQKHTIQLKLT